MMPNDITLSIMFTELKTRLVRNLLGLLARRGSYRLVLVVWCMLLWPSTTPSQIVQHTENKTDQALRSSARIDPATLGMGLQVPLGGLQGRGGTGLPISLSYSSKLWRIKFLTGYQGNLTYRTKTGAEFAEHSASGWTTSLAVPRIEFTGEGQFYNYSGEPLGNELDPEEPYQPRYYISRAHIHMPDGSSHELRKDEVVRVFNNTNYDFSGMLYAVDGSQVRYETATSTLFLPDGSRYILGDPTGWNEKNNQPSPPTTYIDRNGNTLTYHHGSRQWTDTLGRVIGMPLPMTPVKEDRPYAVPGFGGNPITYILRWRYLRDPVTNETVFTDDQAQLHYRGNYTCGQQSQERSPSLFPAGSIDRICDGGLFNPVVLSEIVLPTGQSYRFTYNVYGEIDRVYYPTGGTEDFRYAKIAPLSFAQDPYDEGNRGVVERWVNAGGEALEEHWQYGVSSTSPYVTFTITPDDTRNERTLYGGGGGPGDNPPFGFEDARTGMNYEERVYTSSGQMLRRQLSEWTVTTVDAYDESNFKVASAMRNPRVIKAATLLLDTGGAALVQTTDYDYDEDFNVKSVIWRDYAEVTPAATALSGGVGEMPDGPMIRKEETTFLVNDPEVAAETRAAYRARNMVTLPSSTRIKDGDDGIIARSKISYDETAYPLLPYNGSIVGWSDPGTSLRGNATTVSQWLNTTGAYLSTHMRYDQCGNIRRSISALGQESQIEYSDAYHYAYPTRAISPAPDPSGLNGSDAPFVTTSAYDFTTGLMTSSTDANGQTTKYEYNDPLNRLTRTVLAFNTAVNSQTTVNYDDINHVVTTTGDLNTYNDNSLKSAVVYDGLGRTVETRQYETANDYIATKQMYDKLGRVQLSSNPFRPWQQESPVWTTTQYDALGRVLLVTTPDNASVSNSYSGNAATVADQEGKVRRSIVDSLGRLIRVDEPNSNNGLDDPNGNPVQPTSYSYDALDNLSSVVQGGQTRTFVYDSLKRLTSATNPESGTVTYEYDANGNLDWKQDARGVKTDYTYDHLNRVIERSSSVAGETPADYVAAPVASYYYDGTGMPAGTNMPAYAKWRLTAVKSSVSESIYTAFDAVGRVKQSRQVTDGQSYAMSYEYDLAGNLRSETYPSGRIVETQYDTAGRLLGVTGQAAGGSQKTYASSPSYTAHGALGALKLGNNLWEHTRYNTRLQPEHIGLGTQSTDSSVLALDYSYGTTNNNGNVRSQTIGLPGLTLTQSYTYDELNRLKSAHEANGQTQSWRQEFSYTDANGDHGRFGNRRLSVSETPWLVTENPHYNPANNRIAPQAGEQYAYDAAGNLTRDKGGNAFAYDGESRQTLYNGGASVNGGATYSYDGEGKRVKKVAGVVSTIFVYDAVGRMVAEYSSEAAASNGTQYLTSDNLGTPRVVTGADGAVKARHDYLPFGEEVGANVGGRTTGQGYVGSNLRKRWAQLERDNETGLDYAQARYYASGQGRFTSPDDFLNDTSTIDPASWNLYAYVRNSPLRYVDPTGEKIYVGGLNQIDRDELLKRVSATYGCESCVNVDKDGYLTVNTTGLSKALLKATQFLTEAINTKTWFGEVRVSNNDRNIAFGEGKQGKGTAPFEDGSGRKRVADLIVLDFGDDKWVSGDSKVKEAFLNFVFAHEVAHFRLNPGTITRDPTDSGETGPIVDAINDIQQAQGLPLRAQYSSYGRGGEFISIDFGMAKMAHGRIITNRNGGIVVNKTNKSINWIRRNVGGKGIN
jgi:RHS repeat-associated protein